MYIINFSKFKKPDVLIPNEGQDFTKNCPFIIKDNNPCYSKQCSNINWISCSNLRAMSRWQCSEGGKAHKESSSRKHNQKAPEDMSFIREKTYTLPITLARGLRIRARTKRETGTVRNPTGTVRKDSNQNRRSHPCARARFHQVS